MTAPVPGALARASAWLFAGQVATSVASLATGILCARYLGPEGRGHVALAFVAGSLLAPVALLGVDTYLLARARADRADGAALRRLGSAVALGSGAVILIASGLLGVVWDLPVGVLAAGAVGGALRPAVQWLQAEWLVAGGHRRVGGSSVVAAGTTVALALSWGIGARSAAVFCTITLLAYAANLGALLGVPAPSATTGTGQPLDRGTIVRFGWRSVAADGLQMACYRIDLLLVAAFASVADVGVYTVAVTAAEVLWLLPGALGRALLVRLGDGDPDHHDVGPLALRLALLLTGIGLVGVAGLRWAAEPVLGEGFDRSWLHLAALLPGVVALGACKPVAAALLAAGRVSQNLQAAAAGLGVLLATGFVLVPAHGPVGAALASSAAYGTTAALVVRSWRRGVAGPPSTVAPLEELARG